MQLSEKHQKQNVLTHLISEQHHCLIWLSANQGTATQKQVIAFHRVRKTLLQIVLINIGLTTKSIFTSDLLNFKATILICILINIEIKFIEGTWYKLT